jgi:hypothetical protein
MSGLLRFHRLAPAQGDQDGVARAYARPRHGNWDLVEEMLQRHLNDYAVSGNHLRIWWFCNQVRSLWLASATQPEGQPLLGALHPLRRDQAAATS